MADWKHHKVEYNIIFWIAQMKEFSENHWIFQQTQNLTAKMLFCKIKNISVMAFLIAMGVT